MQNALTIRSLTLTIALLTLALPVVAQNAKQVGNVSNVRGIPVAPLNFGKQTNEAPKPLKLPQAEAGAPKPNTKPTAAKATTPQAEAKPAETLPIAPKPNSALAQTKPSIAAPTAETSVKFNTLDSPTAAIGDSGRMIFFLVPMLLVTYGALKLLQRYQQKTGRLPAALQNAAKTLQTQKPAKSGGIIAAILGSFQLNNARERGGSNIRVVESVPVGGVNIHLVEVRGRLLLLGGSGGSVNLLTEFQEAEIDGGDFRALLNAAAAEMDGLSEYDAIPTSAVVGGIEDDLRGTGEAMQKRLRRLRTVQEAEENPDWMRFDDAR